MKLTHTEIESKLNALPGWALDGEQIRRKFSFTDFKEAMAFVNRVAELAEEMDHHPDILIQYNQVELSLTTHSASGLTEKDFTLAGKINALVK